MVNANIASSKKLHAHGLLAPRGIGNKNNMASKK
jgi:hypothetical protein